MSRFEYHAEGNDRCMCSRCADARPPLLQADLEAEWEATWEDRRARYIDALMCAMTSEERRAFMASYPWEWTLAGISYRRAEARDLANGSPGSRYVYRDIGGVR